MFLRLKRKKSGWVQLSAESCVQWCEEVAPGPEDAPPTPFVSAVTSCYVLYILQLRDNSHHVELSRHYGGCSWLHHVTRSNILLHFPWKAEWYGLACRSDENFLVPFCSCVLCAVGRAEKTDRTREQTANPPIRCSVPMHRLFGYLSQIRLQVWKWAPGLGAWRRIIGASVIRGQFQQKG